MDVPGEVKLRSRVRRAGVARAFYCLTVFGLLAGCFSSEPKEVIPTALDSFDELKQTVIQIRGLALKQDISLEITPSYGGDGAPNKILTENYGPSTVTNVARVYKRIGLLPEITDLGKALADYHRVDRIAYYETQRASVVVRPEALSLGRAFSETDRRIAQEIPVVLGVTQALQEQHFQWQERLKTIVLEDRRLAFRALAIGDATLVALAHTSSDKKVPKLAAAVETLVRLSSTMEKLASDLPELLRQSLVFPYREGCQFVSWGHSTRGWEGVNGLFSSPPLSTSQVLHPEKYYVRQENPLRLFPWGLFRRMKERAAVEQTLGEHLIRVLLSSARAGGEAAQLASRWRGDLLLAYQDGENLVTAWISAWNAAKDAVKFFRAYEAVLARHHRLRFESSAGRNDSLQAEFAGGRSMVLQVKGSLVLLLDGMVSAQSVELGKEIWSDLETETESTVIPFETAKGRRQLPARSR